MAAAIPKVCTSLIAHHGNWGRKERWKRRFSFHLSGLTRGMPRCHVGSSHWPWRESCICDYYSVYCICIQMLPHIEAASLFLFMFLPGVRSLGLVEQASTYKQLTAVFNKQGCLRSLSLILSRLQFISGVVSSYTCHCQQGVCHTNTRLSPHHALLLRTTQLPYNSNRIVVCENIVT